MIEQYRSNPKVQQLLRKLFSKIATNPGARDEVQQFTAQEDIDREMKKALGAIPQREHAVPGFFGGKRVVDGALVERETPADARGSVPIRAHRSRNSCVPQWLFSVVPPQCTLTIDGRFSRGPMPSIQWYVSAKHPPGQRRLGMWICDVVTYNVPSAPTANESGHFRSSFFVTSSDSVSPSLQTRIAFSFGK